MRSVRLGPCIVRLAWFIGVLALGASRIAFAAAAGPHAEPVVCVHVAARAGAEHLAFERRG